ncbi:MAG: DMT family transporter [Haloplanus sp.]
MDRRTLAAFLATSVLFGGTFVATKAGLAHFPPLLFVSLRFDLAAVALLGYAAVTVPRADLFPRSRADVAGILATGVLSIGLTNALVYVGQQYATSAVAAIVVSLNPILTPVFAAVLLADERLSARGVGGLLLGVFGVGLVVGPAPGALLGDAVGMAVLFVGAVSGALGSVLIRWADDDLPSTARTAWGLPFGALLCHLLSLSAGESVAAVTWSPVALLALGYVGLLAGAVAYIAYFGLLDDVGAIRANLVFYLVPVVTALGGWALLGEPISTLAVAGFLVIFAGFALLGSDSLDVRARLPFGRDSLDVRARLPFGTPTSVDDDATEAYAESHGCRAD